MPPDTMIMLPAHNEARHIRRVIDAVRSSLRAEDIDACIVVVDDGSTDETAAITSDAGARVLSLPFNMGYGVALQTGYKYALEEGFDYLVQLDSDGQHDPKGIPVLVDRVKSGRCDICVGSRFLEGDTYAIPSARRIGMIIFRRVASALVGQTITDPTSGFQAMNRKVLEFFARDVFPVDYPDTDVLVLLHRSGFRIGEAPVVMYAPNGSASIHSGIRPAYYLFKMALDIPLNLIRRDKTP